jgi:heme-degrading monooxygenase HmoA
MVITIFRSRLRPEHQQQYSVWAARMHDTAIRMPGFISIKTFTAEDGERVSLVEFESEEAIRAWREHTEHREAQDLGRKLFYSEYRIQVCQPIRDYSFPKRAGTIVPSV